MCLVLMAHFLMSLKKLLRLLKKLVIPSLLRLLVVVVVEACALCIPKLL